jgi:CheY-like chemotaxis protein
MRTVAKAVDAGQTKQAPGARFNCIVWDDEGTFRKQMARRLERMGFVVAKSGNRASLIQKVRKQTEPVVLAVVDWVDQEKADYRAGLELVESISSRHEGCFLMVVTGHEQDLRRQMGPAFENEARAAGADVVKLKGALGILRGARAFQREIMHGIGKKQLKILLKKNPRLDPASAYAGWLAGSDPQGFHLQPTETPPELLMSPDQDAMQVLDRKIERVYEELKSVMQLPDSPENQVTYDQLITELKELQEQQVVRMNVYFVEHQILSDERAESFLREPPDE